MTYPKRLLRLAPRGGIVKDLPPHQVPEQFYTDCTNVIFRQGHASRVWGSRSAYETALAAANPGQILHARNCVLSNNVNYWLIFEADGSAWSLEGQNAAQVDNGLLTATTSPASHTSALLNGLPVYSNGKDDPVYWDGTVLQALPGWTATESCQVIAVFKYHIFALNISGPGGSFPNLIRWSDAAPPGTVPGTWTPAATNEAGDVELADGGQAIIAALPLRDALAVYKTTSMYLAQYVGGNEVFSFRKVTGSIGALAPRAVCDIGGRHVVVSEGDVWITDGTNHQSIADLRVRDTLLRGIDQTHFRNLFCTYNKAHNEVLIGYPSVGNTLCNRAWVYDVQNNSWGQRNLPQVAHAPVGYVSDDTISTVWRDQNYPWQDANYVWGVSQISNAFSHVVLVTDTQMIQQDTQDAVNEPASLVRAGITFGEPERLKFVRRLHVLKGPNSGDLLVRVGAKMTPNGAENLTSEVLLPDSEQVVNLTAVGRYISVYIRSANSAVWQVTGFDIEAELRGYH